MPHPGAGTLLQYFSIRVLVWDRTGQQAQPACPNVPTHPLHEEIGKEKSEYKTMIPNSKMPPVEAHAAETEIVGRRGLDFFLTGDQNKQTTKTEQRASLSLLQFYHLRGTTGAEEKRYTSLPSRAMVLFSLQRGTGWALNKISTSPPFPSREPIIRHLPAIPELHSRWPKVRQGEKKMRYLPEVRLSLIFKGTLKM